MTILKSWQVAQSWDCTSSLTWDSAGMQSWDCCALLGFQNRATKISQIPWLLRTYTFLMLTLCCAWWVKMESEGLVLYMYILWSGCHLHVCMSTYMWTEGGRGTRYLEAFSLYILSFQTLEFRRLIKWRSTNSTHLHIEITYMMHISGLPPLFSV